MFKKFFALMAIVATVATLTTFSVPAAAATYFTNLVVEPSSFNPSTVTAQNAPQIRLHVVANSTVTITLKNGTNVYPISSTDAIAGADLSVPLYGRNPNTLAGTILADGDYVVAVSAVGTPGGTQTMSKNVKFDSTGPTISDLKADPTPFDATAANAKTTISFTTAEDTYLTAVIKNEANTAVRNFTAYNGETLVDAGLQSFEWNGKNDAGSVVADGNYAVYVTAEDLGGNTSTADFAIVVDKDAGHPGDGVLSAITLKPTGTWDPTEKDLNIKFTLSQDVDELLIEAEQGDTTVEIIDEGSSDKDTYEEDWNGQDDGEYVDSGVWKIRVTAVIGNTKYIETKTTTVSYDVPKIDTGDIYVTKDPFDPNKEEYTYLVFKTTDDASVSIEVQESDESTVVELMDEETVDGDKWYAVKWDGKDEDGDIVDEDNYKFFITVSNIDNDNNPNTYTKTVEVKDDEETSDNKVNIYGDYVEPVIVEKNDDVTIGYCLEDDAYQVSVQVYEGKSTSGTGDMVLVDKEAQDQDCYTAKFKFTGKDDDNHTMDEGVFSYKITAKKKGGSESKEEGLFIYGDLGGNNNGDDDDDDDDDDDYTGDCTKYYRDLGSLRDGELCTAIAWVTEQGIFSGYSDGTFKPYQNINRAETLKVLLEAFQAPLLPPNGSNLGFWDLDPYAWYMTYARTAQFYDMLDGYPDNSARLSNYINRVEMLKFALEASHSFTQADVYNLAYNYSDVERTSWYSKYLGAAYTYGLYDSQYYGNSNYLMPAQNVQRGEMALMLYRMGTEGLLK